MSISKTVETWAEVRLERTMCSAVFLRIGDIGTTSTRAAAPIVGGAGAGFGAATGDGAAGRGAAAGEDRNWRSSSAVISDRGRGSAGAIVVGRSPSIRNSTGGMAGAGGTVGGPGGGEGGGTAVGRVSEGGGGGAAAAMVASPSAAMTPTTVLTGTVVPGVTRISLRTPAAGEGISASTLSVEISNSGSSRPTRSPTFFSHLVTVPSAIDSPIWGMMTSVMLYLLPLIRDR